ncbi:hypothetical protein [Trichormus azollae]|uniref:hypothetical protein n=1 Tax=Trichormus azollae TaxID=1164 RepID=UPI00325E2C54
MPSPLRFTPHAKPHAKIITWFCVYQSSIPNMEMGVEPTVRLDDDNEPQPDVILLRVDGLDFPLWKIPMVRRTIILEISVFYEQC